MSSSSAAICTSPNVTRSPIENFDDFPVLRDTSFALVVIAAIFFITSIANFLYHRLYFERLRRRALSLYFAMSLGNIFLVMTGPYLLFRHMPCTIHVIMALMVIPLVALPVPLFLVTQYMKYLYSKTVADIYLEEFNVPNAEATRTTPNGADARGEENYTIESKPAAGFRRKSTLNTVAAPRTSDLSSFATKSNMTNSLFLSGKRLRLLKLLASEKIRLVATVLVFLPFVIYVIVDLATAPHLFPSSACFGCRLNKPDGNFVIASAAVIIVLGVSLALLVRETPDPFGIARQCRLQLQYGGIVTLVGFGMTRVYPDGSLPSFSMLYFIWLGALIMQFAISDWQVLEARWYDAPSWKLDLCGNKTWPAGQNSSRSFVEGKVRGKVSQESPVRNRSHSTQILDASISNLKALLDAPGQPEYEEFENHLVAEHAVELLLFYQECDQFQKKFFDMNAKTKRARAKRIVNLFIENNSVFDVNLPYSMRAELIDAVAQDTTLSDGIFKDCLREVVLMLDGSYKRFLRRKRPAGATPSTVLTSNPV